MKHLRSKLLVVYIGLMALVLLAAGVLASGRLNSYFRQWIANDLVVRAHLVLTSLDSDSSHRHIALEERIRTLAAASAARITLIAADGRVLEDSEVPDARLGGVENHLNRPEIQKASRSGRGTDIRHSATVGVDYLYVAMRIEPGSIPSSSGDPIYLRMSLPLTELDRVASEIRFNIILASLIALVVIAAASVIVSRRIVRPITDITESVATIREGNLAARVPVTTRDEISLVAQAINELMERMNLTITQLKKLEQVRSEFLGNVSHELRTPLFALQGFIETLQDGAIDDPAVNRDFLAKAHNHAMRLNTLLKDLIDISRIESGEMRMSFRYFPLQDFLHSVVEGMHPLADARDISLTAAPGSELPRQVMGDKDRLAQALTNLIDNAIKYTTPGGKVTVAVRDAGDRVWIDVIDTGVGMAAEHLPRIFERFYRVDKERSREAGGTGLGLAIVKHIIEAHGGKVEVHSEPGKGSTFSFSVKK
jgi:two-component system, OmpR family, phosphate regulon sensor histidine kinase PhoR